MPSTYLADPATCRNPAPLSACFRYATFNLYALSLQIKRLLTARLAEIHTLAGEIRSVAALVRMNASPAASKFRAASLCSPLVKTEYTAKF
jgi:hypothetical protein